MTPRTPPPRTGAHLAVRELRYRYNSHAPLVVDGWSADFVGGTITAITGPSGCGKSTRLYLLGLLLGIHSGSIQLDGRRADTLGDAAKSSLRARRFGFVFQDAALDPARSVLDNVCESALYSRLDAAVARQRAAALIERLGVLVPLRRKPTQISGGQAQRIALCRALLNDPDIILADEPTGNLDRRSADIVLGELRQRADAGACVVIATHDPAIATAADQVVSLEDKS